MTFNEDTIRAELVQIRQYEARIDEAERNRAFSMALAAASLYFTYDHLAAANYASAYVTVGLFAVGAINAGIEHDNFRFLRRARDRLGVRVNEHFA